MTPHRRVWVKHRGALHEGTLLRVMPRKCLVLVRGRHWRVPHAGVRLSKGDPASLAVLFTTEAGQRARVA